MRRRIVALAVLVAALALVLFGVPLAIGVAQLAVIEEQASLVRLASVTARSVQTDMAHEELPDAIPESSGDTELAVYDVHGQLLLGRGPRSGDRHVAASLAGHAAQADENGMLIVTVPVTGEHAVHGAVRATRPVASVYQHLVPAWLGMVGLAALVLVAVWQLARRQAGRLAEPLEALSVAARRLGDGDFGVRSPATGVAEIDAVRQALNDTAERLDHLLARERAFSAEASHQLRTPLAGLRLRLESSLELPEPDSRLAVRAGIACADQLERTIEELLLLAREPASTRGEPIDLGGLVLDIVRPWAERLTAAGRSVERTVEEGLPRAPVSAAAVRQILGVLFDNAEVHGAGTVRVTVREAPGAVAVDVADDGAGLTPETFAGTPTSALHGMGLGLARRLAEAENGRLILSRPSPPIFTLLLPVERRPAEDRPARPGRPGGEPVENVEHSFVRADLP